MVISFKVGMNGKGALRLIDLVFSFKQKLK